MDYDVDSAYFQMSYQDGESYFYAYPLKINDLTFEEKGEERSWVITARSIKRR